MKKLTLLISIVCFLLINVYSQTTLELTFTAEYSEQYVPIDSILIENLTQGEDSTLYAPDTVLILDYLAGISDNESIGKNNFTVSQNYPNPFTDQTTISICLSEKEKIEINIHDILGRKVGLYENVLTRGNHKFTLYPGNEKVYFLTVTGEYASKTIKILNANGGSKIVSQCKIVYTSYDGASLSFKDQKAGNGFAFELGDQLRYIAYANTVNEVNGSSVTEDAPQTSSLYELEITEGVPCPGAPTIKYEGLVYNTVQIGDQCWLKENLNIGSMILGNLDMNNNGVVEKYCFENNPDNCGIYGGLYQWNEMMQYDSTNGGQGICPDGWHIPTDEEMKILEGTVDSEYPVGDPEWDQIWLFRGYDVCVGLKSITGWGYLGEGTDLYGFKALPGGDRDPDGYFSGSDHFHIWSSTIDLYDMMLWRWITSTEPDVYRGVAENEYGFSVRCIKDN